MNKNNTYKNMDHFQKKKNINKKKLKIIKLNICKNKEVQITFYKFFIYIIPHFTIIIYSNAMLGSTTSIINKIKELSIFTSSSRTFDFEVSRLHHCMHHCPAKMAWC